MKTETPNNGRKQLNARVPERTKAKVDATCVATGYTRDEVVEVAVESMFGSRDVLVRALRKKMVDAYATALAARAAAEVAAIPEAEHQRQEEARKKKRGK